MSELAIQNLKQYQDQLDENGIFVGVSRQALDEALAYIDTLQAENARLRALTEWQPIESAPRDEYPILAFIVTKKYHDTYIDVIHWNDAKKVWMSGLYVVKPTHWKPLDAPQIGEK